MQNFTYWYTVAYVAFTFLTVLVSAMKAAHGTPAAPAAKGDVSKAFFMFIVGMLLALPLAFFVYSAGRPE